MTPDAAGLGGARGTRERVRDLRSGALVVAFLVVVLMLIAVTLAVALDVAPLHRLDHRVATWGYETTYGRTGWSEWWIAVARYGHPMVVRVVLLALAVVVSLRRGRAWGAWIVAVTVVETVVAPSVKFVLSRPRPEWPDPITVEHSLSYPSGHAAAAGMFTAVVLVLALSSQAPVRRRAAMAAVGGIVGLVIAADRVMLGVHYLSDVVGGVLLGVAIVLAGALVLARATRRTGQ